MRESSILPMSNMRQSDFPTFSLIASDLEAVDQLIRKQLQSNVKLIEQVTEHIIHAGGKRIRPILVLLLAGAFGYKGNHHHTLASVIELIHTSTLLHDDVVDDSMLRRGKPSVNSKFGNATSVLVGDFLYTRAFQMMVSVNDMRTMEALSGTINAIAEGEVMQLINMRNSEMDEASYLDVISAKTAKLFEASAMLGALVAKVPDDAVRMAGEYGHSIGMAFQLVDDMLDYAGDAKALGKNIGNDLREGKMTLPLIYLMQHGTRAQREMIYNCIENKDTDHVDQITAAVIESGALEYTYRKACQMTEAAASSIAALSDSAYKNDLLELSVFATNRKY